MVVVPVCISSAILKPFTGVKRNGEISAHRKSTTWPGIGAGCVKTLENK